MKTKIPPAVVAICCGLLMWITDRYLTTYFSFYALPSRLYILFLLASGAVGLLSLYQFFQNSTSVDPHRPDRASTLVTGGIYNLSRNPMYVSLLIMLAGFACFLQNLTTLFWLPFFVWYMNRFQIEPEEQALAEKFGKAYLEYRSGVRRWL